MSYGHNAENGPGALKYAPPCRAPVRLERGIRRVSVVRDPGYLDWLKQRPCVACVKAGLPRPMPGSVCIQWPRTATIDPAHTVNNGLATKGPDSSCIPLCRHHHDEMDGRLSTQVTTKKQFAAKYGLDLAEESAAHYALYLADEGENSAA